MECGSGVDNNGQRVVLVVVAKDGMEGRGGGGK